MPSPIKVPSPILEDQLREALRLGYTTDLAYTSGVSEWLMSHWRHELGVDRSRCPYRAVRAELRRVLLSAVSAHTATSMAGMIGHDVHYVRLLLHRMRADGLASSTTTGCTLYWSAR